MALPHPLRPAVHAGSDQPDTHLGRPGDGSVLLVAPRSVSETATATVVLRGAARRPPTERAHLTRMLALEEVVATIQEDGADLRVVLDGPADVIDGAVEVLVRIHRALRQRP